MTEPYRVLARRWRPQRLSEVIGQEAMVRTLRNGLTFGRTSHAYLLTGVRGTGKTTTARILARGLCCEEGPTPEPCGQCAHCLTIEADNHPDVTEVDAASNTGVDDMREIVEGARYAPVIARRRIWIIDECHMLSKAAFNALLKTLEQPPDEVVFILCTTEPDKLPMTIRSRCQIHALRRVPDDVLVNHYVRICSAEGFGAEVAALEVIARAAAGSVRDGLSILDAAMSNADDGGIAREAVEQMLGLADRSRVNALLGLALGGYPESMLTAYDALYADGAEPTALCADLLDGVLRLTRDMIICDYGKQPSPHFPAKTPYSLAKLSRAWQLLLKGCSEVQSAPRPEQALAMLLIRLAAVAEMPTPAEVIKALDIKRHNVPHTNLSRLLPYTCERHGVAYGEGEGCGLCTDEGLRRVN